jgi:hypothetical protein
MTPAKKILPYDDPERQAALPERPLSPLEAATFIEGMAAELRLMARGARLDALSYFLEMARIEASAQIEMIADKGGI